MNIKTIVAAVALSALSASAFANVLTTGMNVTTSGRSGMYFDLKAKTNIVLQSFDVQGSASSWDVYYKTGTYAGSELNQSAWTRLTTAALHNSGNLDINDLTLNAGQTIGLYIYANNGTQFYREGNATFSDTNLVFTGGTGNFGLFSNTLDNRILAGNINYKLGTTPTPATAAVPEPASLALLGLGLGIVGLTRARRRGAK